MTVTAMLLVGIAIAVLLYIVVQRLDRIIILQTERRKEHLDALNRHRQSAKSGPPKRDRKGRR